MAYFQSIAQRRPYSTSIGGIRFYLSGNSGQERIVIEAGKRVTLELMGLSSMTTNLNVRPVTIGRMSSTFGAVMPTWDAGPDVISVDAVSGAGRKRTVTLSAIRPGVALLQADHTSPLQVVVGNFKNHTDMEHDLIADVFRASDPSKVHTLQRMLHNNEDNLFNEQSSYNVGKWGPLACGTVSKVGGAAVFFEKLNYDSNMYYKGPISGRTRGDITYDSAKVLRGLAAIKARLAKGIPSIVGLVYIPKTAITRNGSINVNGTGGHTVPIVGCSANGKKFLYIDVFQEGSKLTYEGGHSGLKLFPTECDCLGMFEVMRDAGRGIDIVRAKPGTAGTSGTFAGDQFLEVVTGPLKP